MGERGERGLSFPHCVHFFLGSGKRDTSTIGFDFKLCVCKAMWRECEGVLFAVLYNNTHRHTRLCFPLLCWTFTGDGHIHADVASHTSHSPVTGKCLYIYTLEVLH